MAATIGTLAADVNTLNEIVQFANQIILGDGDATYQGKDYPTRAKLAAAFLMGLNTYATVEDGLAASGESGFFQVVSDLDAEYVVLYQNVNGEAVEKKRYPSAVSAQAILDAYPVITEARDTVVTARDQAVAASEASGIARLFDTYAEAEDATDLNEGDIVEVVHDETRDGMVSRYRYESGALVFKWQPGQRYITANGVTKTQSEWAAEPNESEITAEGEADKRPLAQWMAALTALGRGEIYPRTQGEIDNDITPVSYLYEPDDPRRHGAKNDGSSDASEAANKCLLAGGRAYFRAGRWRIDTSLIPGSGQSIVGDGLGSVLVHNATDRMIRASGTVHEFSALSADVTEGSNQVSLPAGLGAEWGVGDYIVIKSDLPVYALGKSSEATAREIREVVDISGDVLTVAGVFMFDFLTADNAAFAKMDPVRDLTIGGFKIVDTDYDNATLGNNYALRLEWCANVEIKPIHVDRVRGGLHFMECVNVTIDEPRLANLKPEAPWGYGVALAGSCYNVTVNGLIGSNCRHLFTTLSYQTDSVTFQGGPENVTVNGGTGFGGESRLPVFDTHEYGKGITFNGVSAIGSGDAGIQVRSTDTILNNCRSLYNTSRGLTTTVDATGLQINGGDYSHNSTQGMSLPPGARVIGATISNNVQAGIGMGSDASRVEIINNRIEDNQRGIQGGGPGVVVRGNTITQSDKQTIAYLSPPSKSIIEGNNFDGFSGIGQAVVNAAADAFIGRNVVSNTEVIGAPITFASGDATPSVATGYFFLTQNSSATTITNFDDGKEGQEIFIKFGDANTTVKFAGNGNLYGNSGNDYTWKTYDTMRCVYDGNRWLCSASGNS